MRAGAASPYHPSVVRPADASNPVCVLNIVALSPNLIGDATPRLKDFARRSGGVRTLVPPLPAVTCASQSTMLTGLAPSGHGIVGNGWLFRNTNEVRFCVDSVVCVIVFWYVKNDRRSPFSHLCLIFCFLFLCQSATRKKRTRGGEEEGALL